MGRSSQHGGPGQQEGRAPGAHGSATQVVAPGGHVGVAPERAPASLFRDGTTPEPGGIDFLTAMRGVTKVCERVNLIGCDVNELCPPCDPTGASTAAACKIIREMLIAIANRQD